VHGTCASTAMIEELISTSQLTASSRFTPDRDSPRIAIESSDMVLDPLESQVLIVKAKVALFNGAIKRVLHVSLRQK
jgi:hypothetical protein